MDVSVVSQAGRHFEADYAVAVLRKHREAQQAQGQALVRLVTQAPRADGTGQLIDRLA